MDFITHIKHNALLKAKSYPYFNDRYTVVKIG